jgi:hypothetical protein
MFRRLVWCLIPLVSTLCLGCQAGSDDGTGQSTAHVEDALELTGGAVSGLVTSSESAPLDSVTVTAVAAGYQGEEIIGATDAQGRFLLRGLRPSDAVRIKVDHAEYAPSQTVVAVRENEVNSARILLKRYGSAVLIDTKVGGVVTEGNAKVTIQPDSVVDANGNAVSGQVSVRVATIDASSPELNAAPGDFRGRTATNEETVLSSFGMVRVEVKQDDRQLDTKAGSTQVEIEIPSSLEQNMPVVQNGQRVIPSWVYDEGQASWIERGSGVVTVTEVDRRRITWTSDMPTTQLWYNCDKPQPSTCATGRVIDCAGNGIPGARVQVIGVSYQGTSGATSGAGGRYQIRPVALNAQVKVEASLIIGGREYKGEVGPLTTPGSTTECLQVPDVRIAIPDVSGFVTLGVTEDRTGSKAATYTSAMAMFRQKLVDADLTCGDMPLPNKCEVYDVNRFSSEGAVGAPQPSETKQDGAAAEVLKLVDAGSRVELVGDGVDLFLKRRMTDGGPMYSTDPNLNIAAPRATMYALLTAGSPELVSFQVSKAVRMPEPLSSDLNQKISLSGGDVPIIWSAGSENTSVMLTVMPKATEGKAIYCLSDDVGKITIPGSLISQLPSGDATILITRMRVHYFPQPDGVAAAATGMSTVLLPASK